MEEMQQAIVAGIGEVQGANQAGDAGQAGAQAQCGQDQDQPQEGGGAGTGRPQGSKDPQPVPPQEAGALGGMGRDDLGCA